MPYIPGSDTLETLRSLAQGFWLAQEPKMVICVKLEPALINSIIQGCKLEIAIVKSEYSERSVLLVVEDVPSSPFYISATELSNESKKYPGYDTILMKLLESHEIILGLFSLNTAPVFSRILKLETDSLKRFHEWSDTPISDNQYLDLYDENNVLRINLNNYENKKDLSDLNFINIDFDWEEVFRSGSFEDNELVDIHNLFGDGKHGHTQESAIRNVLMKFWSLNHNLFAAPLRDNGNEIIDFILILEKNIVLIESKYVLSTKATKKNAAGQKAIKQLDSAKKYLIDKKTFDGHQISEYSIIQFCITDTQLLAKKTSGLMTSLAKLESPPVFITLTALMQNLADAFIEDETNFHREIESYFEQIWKNNKNRQFYK